MCECYLVFFDSLGCFSIWSDSDFSAIIRRLYYPKYTQKISVRCYASFPANSVPIIVLEHVLAMVSH